MKNSKSADGGPRNVVAHQVRRARLALDVTQDELSGRLAKRQVFLDRVAITKVENGQRCVFDFELKGMAEALKVDVRWLLGMQDSGGPSPKRRAADEL
ncbi:MAG: helix-turn-helix transcriptional regulator [Verrucomicrobia bacterium]|nr:helix-turn-helix transcriptional regulator [Verrucomicrobiota bacterium]